MNTCTIICRYDDYDDRLFELYVPEEKLELGYSGKTISPSVVMEHLDDSKNFACTRYEKVEKYTACSSCIHNIYLFTLLTENVFLHPRSILIEAEEIIDKLKTQYC